MRKLLISLLLASAVATPAFAAPRDDNDRQQAREERQQARSERQQTREQARPERAERSVQFHAPSNDAPGRTQNTIVRRDVEAARVARDSARNQRVQIRDDRIEQRVQARDDRVEQRQLRTGPKVVTAPQEGLRQAERPLPRVLRNRVPVVSSTPREGTQPPARTVSRPSNWVGWNTNWRHNSKYDWYNWRKRHRSLFHLGFYYDPFGWGYRPYSIGWRLWPSYYSSRFWINDPWQYRLPYAPPGYRWVRYYDDALLIDTWNGEVVDVLYNFFW